MRCDAGTVTAGCGCRSCLGNRAWLRRIEREVVAPTCPKVLADEGAERRGNYPSDHPLGTMWSHSERLKRVPPRSKREP
jgi:hypothetical protein